VPEGFKAGSAWMDVKANIDEADWKAKIAAAVEGASAGSSPRMASGLSKGLLDAKPVLERDAADIGKSVGDGIVRGVADAEAPIMDEAERIGKGLGGKVGTEAGKGIDAGIQGAIPAVRESGSKVADEAATAVTTRLRDSRGRFISAGQTVGDEIGKGIGDEIGKGVAPGLDDLDEEIKGKGEKAAKDAGQGMSPLIIAALAGAGAIGGSLLAAGLGTAMVGVTALVLKQNKVIAADMAQVGHDAATSIEQAAAPATAELHADLLAVDKQVRELRPDFKELFSAAEPDIATVTTGLTGFVGGLLPGMSKALSTSQVIVTDFSKSLPVLGADVGGFFTGVVNNANAQGSALEATLNAVGNTIHTVGSVIGAAGTATSVPLIGLTHVINGLDDAMRGVSSPAVVGGVLGAVSALKLDPKIQSGLLSGAEGLSKLADKAEESGGLLGKMQGAASGASGTLAKMAGVVGGPWGIAIGAGIGLASGLAAALFNADDATKAITLSQGDLAAAVAQDAGKIGQSTSAFVAQQAQTSGLADEAKNAGVSLSLLTEAATGNKSAMSQLAAITSQSNEVSRQQQVATLASLTGQTQLGQANQQTAVAVNTLYGSSVQMVGGQNQLNQAMSTGSVRLAQGAEASNTLTDSTQQLLNSVKAQTQQVADAINKQTALDAATAALNNTTSIFNATLDAEYQKLTEKAQSTGDNTVAALNLGDGQSQLNQQLAASVASYQLAASGGSAYGSVLQAMNDTESSLLTSQASFTIALDGVSAAVNANGASLDDTNVKGARNVQVFAGIASSAQKAAIALYQSEVSTKGASAAYSDANGKLLAEKNAFIDAADKAGLNKKKVRELADELYQLPKNIPINVNANTGSAQQAVKHLLNDINSSYGTVQVYAVTHNMPGGGVDLTGGGKALGAGRAGGGPVTAGTLTPVGEHGEETFLSGQDGYVLTHGQTTAMQSRPQAAAAGPQVAFNYYGPQAPGPEQQAQMMRQLAAALS